MEGLRFRMIGCASRVPLSDVVRRPGHEDRGCSISLGFRSCGASAVPCAIFDPDGKGAEKRKRGLSAQRFSISRD